MRYTKDIFDILSKGGFVSQNSMQRALLYDDIAIIQEYQEYYEKIGFLLREEMVITISLARRARWNSTDKVQRMKEWINRVDFLKTFNPTFGSGFTFSQIQYPREVF